MSIKELFGHAIGVVKFGDIAKFYNYLTKRNHTLKGDITFEGGVDVTAATLTGLPPAYATEIAAIAAGLAFGDKYVDSDGIVQTVTKIKQTITLPAGVLNAVGFLIDLDTLPSKNILDVLPGYSGQIIGINSGLNATFVSSQNPVFNTLTAFTNGRGYFFTPTSTFSLDIYGPPLSYDYHTNLTAGNNIVVHNGETTTSTNATSWVSITLTSVTTYVNGVVGSNPTTWNKGQGYLVTTSDGPQAAIGSPSTPVPIDITGEQIVDLLTAENYDSRPYKVYSALVSQTGTSAPTAVILENTLNGTPVFSYVNSGEYLLTLSGAFPQLKYFSPSPVSYYNSTPGDGVVTYFWFRENDNSVRIGCIEGDGELNSAPIEIRVYD
jgi:hypothetical protein